MHPIKLSDRHRISCSFAEQLPRSLSTSRNSHGRLFSIRVICSQGWNIESEEWKRRTNNTSQWLQNLCAERRVGSPHKARYDNSGFFDRNMFALVWVQVDGREQERHSSLRWAREQIKTSTKWHPTWQIRENRHLGPNKSPQHCSTGR